MDDVDDSYNKMAKAFEKIDKKKDEVLNFMVKYAGTYEKYYLPFFNRYLESGMTFMGFMEWVLDPKLCGFKLVKTGMDISGDREVWTDAPCVLIKAGISTRLI